AAAGRVRPKAPAAVAAAIAMNSRRAGRAARSACTVSGAFVVVMSSLPLEFGRAMSRTGWSGSMRGAAATRQGGPTGGPPVGRSADFRSAGGLQVFLALEVRGIDDGN